MTRLDELAARPLPRAELVVEIDDEQVARFAADGFTHLDRITTDEELEWLRPVYDALFEERRGGMPGGYFDLTRPYDAEGPDDLPQVLFPEQRVPALRATVFRRNARRVIARLLAVGEADLHGWGHMIDKPPRHGGATPWHQDEAYWDVAFDYRAVGAWMPLDPVDETNGCMCFVPASHLGPILRHRHIGGDPAVHGLEVDEAVDTAGAVAVALLAGGVTFHHPRMLHSTAPNRTDRRRRACATEFQTPPVPRTVPADPPWVAAGQDAFARRTMFEAP